MSVLCFPFPSIWQFDPKIFKLLHQGKGHSPYLHGAFQSLLGKKHGLPLRLGGAAFLPNFSMLHTQTTRSTVPGKPRKARVLRNIRKKLQWATNVAVWGQGYRVWMAHDQVLNYWCICMKLWSEGCQGHGGGHQSWGKWWSDEVEKEVLLSNAHGGTFDLFETYIGVPEGLQQKQLQEWKFWRVAMEKKCSVITRNVLVNILAPQKGEEKTGDIVEWWTEKFKEPLSGHAFLQEAVPEISGVLGSILCSWGYSAGKKHSWWQGWRWSQASSHTLLPETFHIPKASFLFQGLVHLRLFLTCLLHDWHCTWPPCLILPVVSPQDGLSQTILRRWPGHQTLVCRHHLHQWLQWSVQELSLSYRLLGSVH